MLYKYFLSPKLLIKNTKTHLIKFSFKSYRKLGYDRTNFPDNRIKTGIEVTPYRPQFTLTEDEKKGHKI